MAIAFDNKGRATASFSTISYTTSGSNIALIVAVQSSNLNDITASYAGTSMTKIAFLTDEGGNIFTLLGLLNAASGTNTLAVAGSSINEVLVASYTDVGYMSEWNHGFNTSTVDLTVTFNVADSGAWVVSSGIGRPVSAMNDGAGVTNVRYDKGTSPASLYVSLGDSGSVSSDAAMTWANNNTGSPVSNMVQGVTLYPTASGTKGLAISGQGSVSGGAATASGSFSLNNPAGTVLYVALTGNSSRTVSSVTYNGVSMSSVDRRTSGATWVEWFSLTSPATGSNTLSWTLSGTSDTTISYVSFTGNAASPNGAVAGGSGTSAAPSTTITTTQDNSVVLDAVYVPNTSTKKTYEQALLWATSVGTVSSCGSRETQLTAGSCTMSWQITSGAWVQSVIEVKEAVSAPPASSSESLTLLNVG